MKYFASETTESRTPTPKEERDCCVKVYSARNKTNKVIRFVCEAEDKQSAASMINNAYNRTFTPHDIKEVLRITLDDIPENWRHISFSSKCQYKRVCYIGTHITGKSIEAGIPYMERKNNKTKRLSNNSFWSVISVVYGIQFSQEEAELLNNAGIVTSESSISSANVNASVQRIVTL